MLTANPAIHGWSPVGGNDEDVNLSQHMPFMTFKPFPSSRSTSLSPICPPLDATLPKTSQRLHESQSAPLSPSTGTSSSDRRAQRNRDRDPTWIPRPRNAFIIFRCEYSREHSQGSQQSHNDQESIDYPVKTLSKRAADAWKQLPPSERDRYKALADREREEHSRLYPHYRFRRTKQQASRTRKTSRERSKGPTAGSVERPPATSTRSPSASGSAPRKSHADERAEVSAPIPQPMAAPFPELSSNPVDPRADVPLVLDDIDPVLFYSSLPPDPPPLAPVASPLCTSKIGISTNTFCYNHSAFGLDHEDLARAQPPEAYATGLYNRDLLSPFALPEYF